MFNRLLVTLLFVATAALVGASSMIQSTASSTKSSIEQKIAQFSALEKKGNLDEMQSFKKLVKAKWDKVTINTTTGPIIGACDPDDDVCVFLGVPFAAPPVGALRWMSAKPVANWTTPLDCTWYRPACMQKHMALDPGMSEDCLYMNIYVPKQYLPSTSSSSTSTTTLLPSMIFTFGGSWFFGSGANAGGFGILWYDGTNPVKIASKANTPTIFIAINYRVNAFHGLASPSLKEYNTKHSEGEAGTGAISDQRMAYTWWTANAALFGGDPSRRTIYGESAGSASVSIHLTTPKAWHLFDQALMESGPAADWASRDMKQANESWVEYARKGNCPLSGEASVSCLRAKPASFFVDNLDLEAELKLAAEAPLVGISGLRNGLKWAPVVDGVVVTESPKAAMDGGRISTKPALFHTNRNETTLLAPFNKHVKESEYEKELEKHGINASTAREIKRAYPPSQYTGNTHSTSTFQALCAALTDFAMFCPSRRMAIARNDKLFKQGVATPNTSYTGVLMHETFSWELVQPYVGVPHMMELVSVWDWKFLIWTKADSDLANFYIQSWSRFAHFGSPNMHTATSNWAPFTLTRTGTSTNSSTQGEDSTFLIHSQESVGSFGVNTLNYRKAHCEMWDLLEHTL